MNLDLFQQEKTQSVVEQIKQLIQSELTGLPIDELVESINEIRQATHDISPFKRVVIVCMDKWILYPANKVNRLCFEWADIVSCLADFVD